MIASPASLLPQASRRALLTTLLACSAATLAGCMVDEDGGEGDENAETDSAETDSAESGSAESGEGAGEVPNNPDYCAMVVDWDPAAAALEEEVLTIVNQRRAEGADCGSEGTFAPASPLAMNGRLRCAARNHSFDMATRNYFSHDTPEGVGPGARVDASGYQWSTWGENIAAGSPDAAGTMAQWMESDGHCSNIMDPNYTELGVGYAPGGDYNHVWTQVFGAP